MENRIFIVCVGEWNYYYIPEEKKVVAKQYISDCEVTYNIKNIIPDVWELNDPENLDNISDICDILKEHFLEVG